MGEVKINVEKSNVGELPPVDIPPEEYELEEPGESATEPTEEPIELVTPAQIASLLRWAYKAGEWKTGYEDIWAVSDSELNEIAIRIAPDINRFPMVAKAVAETDQKSGWLLLVYSLASRTLRSIRRKREEQQKQQEEEEQQHVTNESTSFRGVV